jgi:4-hydroxybenzoate polyprenyltransferase
MALKYFAKFMIWTFAVIGVCMFYVLNAYDILFLTYTAIVLITSVGIAYNINKLREKRKKIMTAFTPNSCVEDYHK